MVIKTGSEKAMSKITSLNSRSYWLNGFIFYIFYFIFNKLSLVSWVQMNKIIYKDYMAR